MDAIQSFAAKANRFPLLTVDEELQLTTQFWNTKNKNIFDRLVNHNLRLVMKIAFEYARNADFLSEGSIGLIMGINRFDPNRGTKLSTYVSYWVRAYILSFIMRDHRLIKLGTSAASQKLFFNLHKMKAKIENEGLEVTPDLIAERLGVKSEQVVQMEMRLHVEKQLDQPLFEDGTTTLDFIASEGMTPDEALAEIQRKNILNQFSLGLLPKEKLVLEHRLLQDETLQEVGNRLNLTRERIRQMESKVKEKLKRYCENHNLQLV